MVGWTYLCFRLFSEGDHPSATFLSEPATSEQNIYQTLKHFFTLEILKIRLAELILKLIKALKT